MLDKHFPIYIIVFISTLILTVLIERKMIPLLSKSAAQPIYTEGPKWHIKKSGTPTLGGLGFLIGIFFGIIPCVAYAAFYVSSYSAKSLLISLLFAISNSIIGIIDDFKKLQKKQNAGLTPTEKLMLQFLSAGVFLLLRQIVLKDGTTLSFSFGELNIGFWYYPLSLILLVGIINFANLTDGIDGLASSVAFSVGVALFYISASLNFETSILSSALMGAAIGFLIFNLHPAKIFMGDTGSLFFGALISSAPFMLKNAFLLIFIAGVYVIEGLSVIIQVSVYKLTKKRVFKMAPFHHHLEKSGWSENKICIVAMLTTFVTSIPAYIFYLP